MSFEDTLREFLDSRRRAGGTAKVECRARTLSNYECDLRYFFDFMRTRELTHWNDIKRPDVTAFVDWVKIKTTWSRSTQSMRLRSVRAMFNWIEDDEECEEMGMHGFRKQLGKIKKSDNRKLTFGVEDVRKFLGSFKQHTRAGLRNYTIVQLFADTGMRSGELRHIKVNEHLHLAQRMITVPDEGKTGARPVWIQEQTVSALRKWLRMREQFCEVPYLFCNDTGKRQVSRHVLPQAFRLARIKSGVTGITPHMLRHYHCTVWLAKDGAIEKLMEQSGHKRLESLQHYIHLSGDRSVAAEQRRVNPLEGILPDHRTGKARTQII